MPCLQGELCRCKALPRNASTRRIWSGPKTFLGNALNFEAIMKKDEELDRQRQQRSRRENCSSMIMRKEEKISTLVSPDGSNSGSLLVAMSMETRLLLFLSVGFLSLPFWLNRQGLCPVYIWPHIIPLGLLQCSVCRPKFLRKWLIRGRWEGLLCSAPSTVCILRLKRLCRMLAD